MSIAPLDIQIREEAFGQVRRAARQRIRSYAMAMCSCLGVFAGLGVHESLFVSMRVSK
jgi:hypothetical protein